MASNLDAYSMYAMIENKMSNRYNDYGIDYKIEKIFSYKDKLFVLFTKINKNIVSEDAETTDSDTNNENCLYLFYLTKEDRLLPYTSEEYDNFDTTNLIENGKINLELLAQLAEEKSMYSNYNVPKTLQSGIYKNSLLILEKAFSYSLDEMDDSTEASEWARIYRKLVSTDDTNSITFYHIDRTKNKDISDITDADLSNEGTVTTYDIKINEDKSSKDQFIFMYNEREITSDLTLYAFGRVGLNALTIDLSDPTSSCLYFADSNRHLYNYEYFTDKGVAEYYTWYSYYYNSRFRDSNDETEKGNINILKTFPFYEKNFTSGIMTCHSSLTVTDENGVKTTTNLGENSSERQGILTNDGDHNYNSYLYGIGEVYGENKVADNSIIKDFFMTTNNLDENYVTTTSFDNFLFNFYNNNVLLNDVNSGYHKTKSFNNGLLQRGYGMKALKFVKIGGNYIPTPVLSDSIYAYSNSIVLNSFYNNGNSFYGNNNFSYNIFNANSYGGQRLILNYDDENNPYFTYDDSFKGRYELILNFSEENNEYNRNRIRKYIIDKLNSNFNMDIKYSTIKFYCYNDLDSINIEETDSNSDKMNKILELPLFGDGILGNNRSFNNYSNYDDIVYLICKLDLDSDYNDRFHCKFFFSDKVLISGYDNSTLKLVVNDSDNNITYDVVYNISETSVTTSDSSISVTIDDDIITNILDDFIDEFNSESNWHEFIIIADRYGKDILNSKNINTIPNMLPEVVQYDSNGNAIYSEYLKRNSGNYDSNEWNNSYYSIRNYHDKMSNTINYFLNYEELKKIDIYNFLTDNNYFKDYITGSNSIYDMNFGEDDYWERNILFYNILNNINKNSDQIGFYDSDNNYRYEYNYDSDGNIDDDFYSTYKYIINTDKTEYRASKEDSRKYKTESTLMSYYKNMNNEVGSTYNGFYEEYITDLYKILFNTDDINFDKSLYLFNTIENSFYGYNSYYLNNKYSNDNLFFKIDSNFFKLVTTDEDGNETISLNTDLYDDYLYKILEYILQIMYLEVGYTRYCVIDNSVDYKPVINNTNYGYNPATNTITKNFQLVNLFTLTSDEYDNITDYDIKTMDGFRYHIFNNYGILYLNNYDISDILSSEQYDSNYVKMNSNSIWCYSTNLINNDNFVLIDFENHSMLDITFNNESGDETLYYTYESTNTGIKICYNNNGTLNSYNSTLYSSIKLGFSIYNESENYTDVYSYEINPKINSINDDGDSINDSINGNMVPAMKEYDYGLIISSTVDMENNFNSYTSEIIDTIKSTFNIDSGYVYLVHCSDGNLRDFINGDSDHIAVSSESSEIIDKRVNLNDNLLEDIDDSNYALIKIKNLKVFLYYDNDDNCYTNFLFSTTSIYGELFTEFNASNTSEFVKYNWYEDYTRFYPTENLDNDFTQYKYSYENGNNAFNYEYIEINENTTISNSLFNTSDFQKNYICELNITHDTEDNEDYLVTTNQRIKILEEINSVSGGLLDYSENLFNELTVEANCTQSIELDDCLINNDPNNGGNSENTNAKVSFVEKYIGLYPTGETYILALQEDEILSGFDLSSAEDESFEDFFHINGYAFIPMKNISDTKYVFTPHDYDSSDNENKHKQVTILKNNSILKFDVENLQSSVVSYDFLYNDKLKFYFDSDEMRNFLYNYYNWINNIGIDNGEIDDSLLSEYKNNLIDAIFINNDISFNFVLKDYRTNAEIELEDDYEYIDLNNLLQNNTGFARIANTRDANTYPAVDPAENITYNEYSSIEEYYFIANGNKLAIVKPENSGLDGTNISKVICVIKYDYDILISGSLESNHVFVMRRDLVNNNIINEIDDDGNVVYDDNGKVVKVQDDSLENTKRNCYVDIFDIDSIYNIFIYIITQVTCSLQNAIILYSLNDENNDPTNIDMDKFSEYFTVNLLLNRSDLEDYTSLEVLTNKGETIDLTDYFTTMMPIHFYYNQSEAQNDGLGSLGYAPNCIYEYYIHRINWSEDSIKWETWNYPFQFEFMNYINKYRVPGTLHSKCLLDQIEFSINMDFDESSIIDSNKSDMYDLTNLNIIYNDDKLYYIDYFNIFVASDNTYRLFLGINGLVYVSNQLLDLNETISVEIQNKYVNRWYFWHNDSYIYTSIEQNEITRYNKYSISEDKLDFQVFYIIDGNIQDIYIETLDIEENNFLILTSDNSKLYLFDNLFSTENSNYKEDFTYTTHENKTKTYIKEQYNFDNEYTEDSDDRKIYREVKNPRILDINGSPISVSISDNYITTLDYEVDINDDKINNSIKYFKLKNSLNDGFFDSIQVEGSSEDKYGVLDDDGEYMKLEIIPNTLMNTEVYDNDNLFIINMRKTISNSTDIEDDRYFTLHISTDGTDTSDNSSGYKYNGNNFSNYYEDGIKFEDNNVYKNIYFLLNPDYLAIEEASVDNFKSFTIPFDYYIVDSYFSDTYTEVEEPIEINRLQLRDYRVLISDSDQGLVNNIYDYTCYFIVRLRYIVSNTDFFKETDSDGNITDKYKLFINCITTIQENTRMNTYEELSVVNMTDILNNFENVLIPIHIKGSGASESGLSNSPFYYDIISKLDYEIQFYILETDSSTENIISGSYVRETYPNNLIMTKTVNVSKADYFKTDDFIVTQEIYDKYKDQYDNMTASESIDFYQLGNFDTTSMSFMLSCIEKGYIYDRYLKECIDLESLNSYNTQIYNLSDDNELIDNYYLNFPISVDNEIDPRTTDINALSLVTTDDISNNDNLKLYIKENYMPLQQNSYYKGNGIELTFDTKIMNGTKFNYYSSSTGMIELTQVLQTNKLRTSTEKRLISDIYVNGLKLFNDRYNTKDNLNNTVSNYLSFQSLNNYLTSEELNYLIKSTTEEDGKYYIDPDIILSSFEVVTNYGKISEEEKLLCRIKINHEVYDSNPRDYSDEDGIASVGIKYITNPFDTIIIDDKTDLVEIIIKTSDDNKALIPNVVSSSEINLYITYNERNTRNDDKTYAERINPKFYTVEFSDSTDANEITIKIPSCYIYKTETDNAGNNIVIDENGDEVSKTSDDTVGTNVVNNYLYIVTGSLKNHNLFFNSFEDNVEYIELSSIATNDQFQIFQYLSHDDITDSNQLEVIANGYTLYPEIDYKLSNLNNSSILLFRNLIPSDNNISLELNIQTEDINTYYKTYQAYSYREEKDTDLSYKRKVPISRTITLDNDKYLFYPDKFTVYINNRKIPNDKIEIVNTKTIKINSALDYRKTLVGYRETTDDKWIKTTEFDPTEENGTNYRTFDPEYKNIMIKFHRPDNIYNYEISLNMKYNSVYNGINNLESLLDNLLNISCYNKPNDSTVYDNFDWLCETEGSSLLSSNSIKINSLFDSDGNINIQTYDCNDNSQSVNILLDGEFVESDFYNEDAELDCNKDYS